MTEGEGAVRHMRFFALAGVGKTKASAARREGVLMGIRGLLSCQVKGRCS
jgi:hypothetical protein